MVGEDRWTLGFGGAIDSESDGTIGGLYRMSLWGKEIRVKSGVRLRGQRARGKGQIRVGVQGRRARVKEVGSEHSKIIRSQKAKVEDLVMWKICMRMNQIEGRMKRASELQETKWWQKYREKMVSSVIKKNRKGEGKEGKKSGLTSQWKLLSN